MTTNPNSRAEQFRENSQWVTMQEAAAVLDIHPLASHHALANGNVPTFKHKGIRYVLQRDLDAFATDYPKQLWSEDEEMKLRRMWGHCPLSTIAKVLRRSETAVTVRAKRLKLGSPINWPNILTHTRLAPLLGLDPKTVWKLMQEGGPLPSLVMYRREIPVRVVEEHTMIRWLSKPENLIYIDKDKVTYWPFCQAIEGMLRKWKDSWLSPTEVAQMLGVDDTRPVNKLVHQGALKGIKYGNWRILKSSVERCIQVRGGSVS